MKKIAHFRVGYFFARYASCIMPASSASPPGALMKLPPFRQSHVVTDDFLSVKLRHGFFLTPAGMAAPDYFPSGRHFSVPTLDLNQ